MPFSKLKGRKVMLCNMLYQGPTKKTEWHDYIIAIYRDLVTNKKESITIEDPTIKIYSVKPQYRKFKKARHFLKKEMLDEHEIKYKNLYREIAKIAGPEYLEYYNTHTGKERKALFKYPYVLGGDVDIETYYRVIWMDQCGFDGKKSVTKGYFDIEVDQIDFVGNIAKNGETTFSA